jgi:hypothetical protein
MSLGDCIPGPGHGHAVQVHMDAFETALTKRWRIEVVRELVGNKPVTTFLARSTGPFGAPDLSALQDVRYQRHKGLCHYSDWAFNKPDGDLPASCPGETGYQGSEPPEENPTTPGTLVQIPRKITCPIPKVMEMVATWAEAERQSLEPRVPVFDAHQQSRLSEAYTALARFAAETDVDVPKQSGQRMSSGGALPDTVTSLWVQNSEDRDWWVGWTGLAANAAKGNFFTSTLPTLRNHSIIAVALADLVSNRSAIVEYARNNGKHLITGATVALDAKTTASTDLVPTWKGLQAIGMSVALYGAFSGPGAVATAVTGGALGLVGFLGENLLPKTSAVAFSGDLKAIVTTFSDKLDELGEGLTRREGEYGEAADTLRTAVNGASSFELELYDLSENQASGTGDRREEPGFQAPVDNILTLGATCEKAAGDYEGLLWHFNALAGLETDMADKDGTATRADEGVLALCDELHEYVKTTAARYYLARDQIMAAAADYAETDEGRKAAFDRVMSDWSDTGTGQAEPNPRFDVESEAKDSVRPGGADRTPGYDELEGEQQYVTGQTQ